MAVTWNRVLLFAAFILLLLMTLQSAGVAPIGGTVAGMGRAYRLRGVVPDSMTGGRLSVPYQPQ